MWDDVVKLKPKAWVWLGDNIYGDTEDMTLMKSKYDMQKQRASYQNLRKAMDIYGIWDDHDYGINNGGKEYPMKDESKALLLDFLDVPADAEVRDRKGAYQSYVIEDSGLKIKLILLDTRYFRDTIIKNPNEKEHSYYLPDPDGIFLGEAQWQWLEKELANSDAHIHLFGSGVPLIPDPIFEKWGNFPNERTRFFELLVKTKPARPIILSGDRHFAEFSKIELEGLSYPLYEFTSSGLTHTVSPNHIEINSFRIGNLIIKKNFGVIHISHAENDIAIKMQIRGSDNQVYEEVVLVF
ncbi:MAG: alkaline phosphatase family protein [Flavobacteriaceae bacterium]|nr:alkaline phosphatase family protein [Flavobacteriaceae bacterium]